jgi:hypothetical protein
MDEGLSAEEKNQGQGGSHSRLGCQGLSRIALLVSTLVGLLLYSEVATVTQWVYDARSPSEVRGLASQAASQALPELSPSQVDKVEQQGPRFVDMNVNSTSPPDYLTLMVNMVGSEWMDFSR